MHINADKNTITPTTLPAATKVYAAKVQNPVETKVNQRDTLELSNINKVMRGVLSADVGTASHTTLYVDNSTFQKIATYSTNHPETRWSEIGVDENKRWIVVNGQRFESPISEEEKAMRKRAQMTLGDYLEEHEENKKEKTPKEKVTLNFLTGNAEAQASTDPKITSLLQNEKVMDMLKNISKASKGQLVVSI
ncbi:hypothetical protein QWT69_13745 [Sporosarcina oncorhynchi]|uniref:Uncharacterized protein n=1 Tax=Sporosarcina oncorhynchi TaxID=3056444 RepID=A0ABZ0L5J1_9BACL|nr:hypothetical protein [Sporosarcina sp. T2O-4]WOV86922.1 hypothetical protein QWT69_13745 [Sporosarcina sp. T2O-4]